MGWRTQGGKQSCRILVFFLIGTGSGKSSFKYLSIKSCTIQRRAKLAGIVTEICPHTFRATGITNYLTNSGSLEIAQQMAAHADGRATKLYDRRNEQVSIDEIERITISEQCKTGIAKISFHVLFVDSIQNWPKSDDN